MPKLLIVESPAKAKTIAKYLGKDYTVKASMGHLRDLPKKEMGVDIEGGFTPRYIPIEGKDKVIDELKSAVSKSDFVYLATDPDREGEAISWHLKELLKLDNDSPRRVVFNEVTKRAVSEAVKSPRAIDENLVNSQQARRILDRIVGYELSPFLWRKIRRGLSAGRVQSVVTRLVVDRELEIRGFVPKEYWTIAVDLLASRQTFTANFHGDKKGKIELSSEAETKAVLSKIDGAAYLVEDIRRAEKKRQPSPPFITSTLQQEASRKFNMPSRRTMSVAQTLYEGIDIKGHGMTGLITYMRTDSLRLSFEATDAAREYIEERFGHKFIPSKTRVFKNKNAAQDAHEAIRPTNIRLTPEDVKPNLTADQYKLYRLIWSRFVACQMADAVFDTESVSIGAAGYMFRASGQTLRFAGYTAVYEESADDAKEPAAKALPALSEGMELKHKKTTPEQHFTQPPARYTEASLIRAMEEKGIGRPSTYAPTISTILDREYVEKDAKSLKPTALGEVVTELMKDKFKDIIDVKFTALMENDLDEIESGNIDYKTLLERFYKGFSETLKTAEKDLEKKRIKVHDEETDVICDKCGRKMVKKYGRFGKFLACPGYPECKNTKPLAEDTGVLCPVCGGRLLKKKSKNGYYYFGCEKHPECAFMTWDKPTNRKCPNCGSTIFKRFTASEKKNLCLKEGCSFEEPLKTRKGADDG